VPFWNRPRPALDRISPEQLADFGRYAFLGPEQSGVDPAGTYSLISDLGISIYTQGPAERARVVAELRRHATNGEWEKVGAWKFVREFLDEAPDTADLIDGGLLAIARMRVTNLAIHLAPIDTPRFAELTGGPVPHDGFFGPPVFDSGYGPTRQYYLGDSIEVAARRSVSRLEDRPGVAPGPVAAAARGMWDFGLLIYRGPLVVDPDITFEPNVVRPAVAVADGADHALFIEQVAAAILDSDDQVLSGAWPSIGAARFAEDYLSQRALGTNAHRRLLDAGLRHFLHTGALGLLVAPELLTPLQQQRLGQIRAGP
jgi:hypothetical protein